MSPARRIHLVIVRVPRMYNGRGRHHVGWYDLRMWWIRVSWIVWVLWIMWWISIRVVNRVTVECHITLISVRNMRRHL